MTNLTTRGESIRGESLTPIDSLGSVPPRALSATRLGSRVLSFGSRGCQIPILRSRLESIIKEVYLGFTDARFFFSLSMGEENDHSKGRGEGTHRNWIDGSLVSRDLWHLRIGNESITRYPRPFLLSKTEGCFP